MCIQGTFFPFNLNVRFVQMRIIVTDSSSLHSCATTGEGLFEGLQWLSQNVKKQRQP